MFLSEIIGNEFVQWEGDTQVLIHAPTGMGKTTFVVKTLLPYAVHKDREILYLSNRSILHQQLVQELCSMYDIPYSIMADEKVAEFRGITLTTYQTLQTYLREQKAENFGKFFYVVLDEIHYLMSDSLFNAQIQYLYQWMSQNTFRVRIAISATIEEVLPYLNYYDPSWQAIGSKNRYRCTFLRYSNRSVYNALNGIPEILHCYDISTKMPRMQFFIYKKSTEVIEKINEDQSDEKWLMFLSNKENAQQLLEKSIHKAELLTAEKKQSEAMQKIVKKQKFEEKLLLTTKVLDNGISLKDPKIKNVVLDTIDKTDFLQMLGRRRILEGEEVILKVYIPQKSTQTFSLMLQNFILPALELLQMPDADVLERIFQSEQDYRRCIQYFDYCHGELKKNEFAVKKLNNMRIFCQKMKTMLQNDEFAFVKEQLSWLRCEDQFQRVIILEEEKQKKVQHEILEYLKKQVKKPKDKVEQKELREKMRDFMLLTIPEEIQHKHRLPGLKQINQYMRKMDFPFQIESVSGKKKGDQTKWIVVEYQVMDA